MVAVNDSGIYSIIPEFTTLRSRTTSLADSLWRNLGNCDQDDRSARLFALESPIEIRPEQTTDLQGEVKEWSLFIRVVPRQGAQILRAENLEPVESFQTDSRETEPAREWEIRHINVNSANVPLHLEICLRLPANFEGNVPLVAAYWIEGTQQLSER
jgi:hypothetical protein